MFASFRAPLLYLFASLMILSADGGQAQNANAVVLSEAHLEGFIGVMPQLRAIAARNDNGGDMNTLASDAVGAIARTQQTMSELTELLHKNGFADAEKWGDVASSIAMAYNWLSEADDPELTLGAQIAELQADTSLSDAQKEPLIDALEEQRAMIAELKPPADNLALVARYRDKIAAALAATQKE